MAPTCCICIPLSYPERYCVDGPFIFVTYYEWADIVPAPGLQRRIMKNVRKLVEKKLPNNENGTHLYTYVTTGIENGDEVCSVAIYCFHRALKALWVTLGILTCDDRRESHQWQQKTSYSLSCSCHTRHMCTYSSGWPSHLERHSHENRINT